MPKIKVVIDGTEHEVDLPQEYIHESEITEKYVSKEVVDDLIKRRIKNAKENASKELAKDVNFFVQLAKERGIPVTDDGEYKPNKDVDVSKIRAEIAQTVREQEIKPLETKIQKLLSSQLQAEIVQSASEAGISKALLTPVIPGTPPPIVNMLRDYFAYDSESEQWVVKDGEHYRLSTTPASGKPFMGVREFIFSLQKNDSWSNYFEDTRQRGSNYQRNITGNFKHVSTKADLKTVEDKVNYIKEYGREAFEKLPPK